MPRIRPPARRKFYPVHFRVAMQARAVRSAARTSRSAPASSRTRFAARSNAGKPSPLGHRPRGLAPGETTPSESPRLGPIIVALGHGLGGLGAVVALGPARRGSGVLPDSI